MVKNSTQKSIIAEEMTVLVFSGYYLPGYKGGGPIKTIKNLISQTSKTISYKVITLDRDLGATSAYNNIEPNRWNEIREAKVFYTSPSPIGIKQILKLLIEEDHDIVYLNSFFSTRFSFFPLLLSKFLKQQVVLGPRGEFSPGALKLKPKKKELFIKAYKLFGLPKDIVFQASSEYEAEDIKKLLGEDTDIVIAEDIGSQEFVTNIPKREQIMKAVFISRISPMKNLAFALEILNKVKGYLVYDIYGPIEDEPYWRKCQKIIADLPPNISVRYKGEVKPENVISVLSKYDFFFMPTQGENYGHVIAEALCAALPLVISDTTPWRNLKRSGIGWDLPLDNPNAFIEAIDQLIKMSNNEHNKMRQTVLNWAKEKFAQREAIEANIAMFRYAYNKKKGINNVI